MIKSEITNMILHGWGTPDWCEINGFTYPKFRRAVMAANAQGVYLQDIIQMTWLIGADPSDVANTDFSADAFGAWAGFRPREAGSTVLYAKKIEWVAELWGDDVKPGVSLPTRSDRDEDREDREATQRFLEEEIRREEEKRERLANLLDDWDLLPDAEPENSIVVRPSR